MSVSGSCVLGIYSCDKSFLESLLLQRNTGMAAVYFNLPSASYTITLQQCNVGVSITLFSILFSLHGIW